MKNVRKKTPMAQPGREGWGRYRGRAFTTRYMAKGRTT